MRNGKYITTIMGRASANAARKLGDLHLTTCTFQRTIQMDYSIIKGHRDAATTAFIWQHIGMLMVEMVFW